MITQAMNYCYVLKSTKRKWHYIGSTRDLKTRFSQHNLGEVESTKPYRPFELIYYEAYNTYTLARKREIELKNKSQQKEILFQRLGIN